MPLPSKIDYPCAKNCIQIIGMAIHSADNYIDNIDASIYSHFLGFLKPEKNA